MPSMAMLRRRLRTSSLNFSGHVSFIYFMAIKSIGIRITPNSLLCEACHPCNIANSLQRKSLWILGIKGMCLNILKGGPHDLPLFFYLSYLSCPHFVHISLSAYSPLYRIESLDMHDMICTQHPTFSTIYLPLRSYQARHYRLEEPYIWITSSCSWKILNVN